MAGRRSAKRDKKDDEDEFDDTVEEQRFLTAVAPEGAEADKETCKTFRFRSEGHTLGNALRFVISTYPDVLLCAYTMPHPAEDVMNFRIQTTVGIKPEDVLQRGLHDLIELSKVVIEKFEDAVANAPPPIPDDEPKVVKS